MRKLMLILILLLSPQLVSAGVISLTATISTDVMTENTTKVLVKLLNSGDEAAHNVQISLLTDDFESNPIFVGILNLNVPFERNFTVSLKEDILPGNYPIVVLVDYADANGYPFSSVSPSYITYKTPTVSKLSSVVSELVLAGKETKKLTLTVRNLDDFSHNLNVKLILPRELKVDEERTISTQPKEEKELNFDVSSFSALPGSSYVVLANIEYDYNGLHYSSIGRGTVMIGEESTSILPNWLPITGIIFLGGVFILYQFKGKL
jgi:hypothetical protein